jgi:hypothetical protein
MNKSIDIGQIIQDKLSEQKRSVAWLACELDIDCSNLHKTLKNKGNHIDVVLLYRISAVMDSDFFVFYSQQLKQIKDDTQKDLQTFDI